MSKMRKPKKSRKAQKVPMVTKRQKKQLELPTFGEFEDVEFDAPTRKEKPKTTEEKAEELLSKYTKTITRRSERKANFNWAQAKRVELPTKHAIFLKDCPMKSWVRTEFGTVMQVLDKPHPADYRWVEVYMSRSDSFVNLIDAKEPIIPMSQKEIRTL